MEAVSQPTNTAQPKSSLCRYFLRGLCVFAKDKCQYSHGVVDLSNFRKYEGEPIIWEYKKTDFDQSKLIGKVKRYVHLYQFQAEKIHSEDELNEDRKLREKLRNRMLRCEAEKFMELLVELYPEESAELLPISQKFLEREFTRAGFHKITNTINFKRICQYLTNNNDPDAKFMVIDVDKKSVIARRPTRQAIQSEYVKRLRTAIESMPPKSQLRQNELKRIMFKNPSDLKECVKVPSLMQWLRQLNDIPFMEYMHLLVSQEQALQQFMLSKQISFQGEAGVDQLTNFACHLIKSGKKSASDLNRIMEEVAEHFQINNNNQLNAVKLKLLEQGFKIYCLPMLTFIYDQTAEQSSLDCSCPCPLKASPDLSHIRLVECSPLEKWEMSIVIDTREALSRCLPKILESHVLAVDLEGRLRKNGHLEMVQLNNGAHVFLLDIYKIVDMNCDFELFDDLKLVLRKVMTNPNIVKIFHDSRHDCLSLHQIINTCVINVFDTSGIEIIRLANQVHQNAASVQAKLQGLLSFKTVGLNTLLKKYEAPHGINKSKDKFHQMMEKAESHQIFRKRPLNQEYKEYCVKDVLDLIHLYIVMSEGIPDSLIKLVGDLYVRQGYERTL